MRREKIRAIFVAAGFKTRVQDDGTTDLNPYVYDAAEALLQEASLNVPEGATHIDQLGSYFKVPSRGHEDGTWDLWVGGQWVTTEGSDRYSAGLYRLVLEGTAETSEGTTPDRPEFKLIVAGGRNFADVDVAWRTIYAQAAALSAYSISIVSGMARGADSLAVSFANKHDAEVYKFPADWENLSAPGAVIAYGEAGAPYNANAGRDRNIRMGDFADGLLAFWDGKSNGTLHMINYMRYLNKPVWVYDYSGVERI